MTESLTSRVSKATQQIEDAGKVYSEVKCADSNTMVDTGCGQVPSLRKVLKDLGGYQYKGVWAADTEYEAKDQVKDADGAIWLCIEDHTSGAEFDADAQAGKWIAFQVIRDTPVFNRRVIDFGLDIAFGPYKEDGRVLLPRLRIDGVEYFSLDAISENLTFTSAEVNDLLDGTVLINTSDGEKAFSRIGAEAVARYEQSRDMSIYPLSWYGAKGDGENDDTSSFETAIASASIHGGVVIGEKGKRYKITRMLHISADNVTVDMCGSTVIWHGVNTNNSGSRANGIFNFRGKSTRTDNVKGYIQLSERESFSNLIIMNGDYTNRLSEGDRIFLESVNSTGDNKAHYDLPTKIDKIILNSKGRTEVTVSAQLAWNFNGDFRIIHQSPIFNSGIKNVNLEDAVSSTVENGVCGVNMMITVDCFAENVNMTNMWNPVFTVYSSTGHSIIGGEATDAKVTGGGQGYYVQYGSSTEIYCEGVKLTRGRHVIDFTSCTKAYVVNCHGYNNIETDFSLHGEYETDITYDGCSGTFGIAISGSHFGETAKNTTIRNCRGKVLYNYAQALNVVVENSTFNFISTNCLGTEFKNVTALDYVRFTSTGHLAFPEVERHARVYGGYIKGESYSGANFIPEGVFVEFFGTEVDARFQSQALVNMHTFTMHGGVFKFGFNTPRTKGTWIFNNVLFDNTCFELNGNLYGGSVLVFNDPLLRNSVNTGLIRNRIPTSGIRKPYGDESSDLTQKATVFVNGGYLRVDDKTHKTLDFAQPSRCLNVYIRDVYVHNGEFACDTRWQTDNAGIVRIDLAGAGNDATVNLAIPEEHKHLNTLNNLNEEYGQLNNYKRSNTLNNVTVYTLDHNTNAAGFLAYNYPLDEQPKGLLTVETSHNKTYCKQTLAYSYPGKEYNGRIYFRISRYGEWSNWVLLN